MAFTAAPTTTRRTQLRYESARVFPLSDINQPLGNVLRQIFLDEFWCLGLNSPLEERATWTKNVRCLPNDTLAENLRMVPLTLPLPEAQIRSVRAWVAAYEAWSESYHLSLRASNPARTTKLLTTEHLHVVLRATGVTVDEETRRVVSAPFLHGQWAHALVGHLSPALVPALSAATLVPVCQLEVCSARPVKALWNKCYTVFDTVNFQMRPDETLVAQRRRAIELEVAGASPPPERLSPEKAERLRARLEVFEARERPLLLSRTEGELTLRLAAPYYSYDFALRMARALLVLRLESFLERALPALPIRRAPGGGFQLELRDAHFLAAWEEPLEALWASERLAYPTHCYAHFLAQWVAEEMFEEKDEQLRVLVSTFDPRRNDAPLGVWHLLFFQPHFDEAAVRLFLQNTLREIIAWVKSRKW